MGVPHSSHFRWTMYRLVPGGLHDSGPNPQPELPPALPQRPHFSSSSSSLLRTYCFWPRLRCTYIIRMHPPLLLFSRDSHNQSPASLFGSPAASFLEALRLCAPASRRGCPSRSASKEDAPTLVLLSASRESPTNIISESQCLGAGLPLFTESPRRLILGNPDSYARIPMQYRGVGKRA